MKLTQFGYMNSRQPTAEELKRVTPAELGFATGVFHSGKVYSGGFSIYRSSVEREQFKEGCVYLSLVKQTDWNAERRTGSFKNGESLVKKIKFKTNLKIKLAQDWLEKHPDATEAEAYEKTADGAHDRMSDNLGNMADALRRRAKEGQR